MEITPKIRKLIYGMFDDMIEGANKYVTKSSTWLIFTEEKIWVIEFTKEKILWFNYNTFQSELALVGMDCVDSKDVIKEWFESRFLGIEVEDTIQNGVKSTSMIYFLNLQLVEDTIENGVKKTKSMCGKRNGRVDNIVQNGVKTMMSGSEWYHKDEVEEIIQKGVKETIGTLRRTKLGVDDIIQNGVKE